MNNLIISGRLVRTPQFRTNGDKARANFTLAVDNGTSPTSFVPVTCFGRTAELVAEHTDKGHLIAIEGRITSGKYVNDNGETVYTLDVIANRVEFLKAPGFPRRVTGDASTSEVAPSEPSQADAVPA